MPPVKAPPTQSTVPFEFASKPYVPLLSSAAARASSVFSQPWSLGGAGTKTYTIAVPALASGASTTLTQPVSLADCGLPTSVQLAVGQRASIVVTAVLGAQPPDLVASAPALSAPTTGWTFQGPTSVGNITTTVSITVYAPSAYAGGSLQVTVGAMLGGVAA